MIQAAEFMRLWKISEGRLKKRFFSSLSKRTSRRQSPIGYKEQPPHHLELKQELKKTKAVRRAIR